MFSDFIIIIIVTIITSTYIIESVFHWHIHVLLFFFFIYTLFLLLSSLHFFQFFFVFNSLGGSMLPECDIKLLFVSIVTSGPPSPPLPPSTAAAAAAFRADLIFFLCVCVCVFFVVLKYYFAFVVFKSVCVFCCSSYVFHSLCARLSQSRTA